MYSNAQLMGIVIVVESAIYEGETALRWILQQKLRIKYYYMYNNRPYIDIPTFLNTQGHYACNNFYAILLILRRIIIHFISIVSPPFYIPKPIGKELMVQFFVLQIYLQCYGNTASDIVLVDCFDRMTVDVGHIGHMVYTRFIIPPG